MRIAFFLLFFVSNSLLASTSISDGLIRYSPDTLINYSLGSDVELESKLESGEEIEVSINKRLSIRGSDFKESFVPAEEVSNLPGVISYSLPSTISPAAILHVRFGVNPVCELMLIDSKWVLINEKARDKFLNSLSRKKIKYSKKLGYFSASCKANK
jgi:hypothetical protein